LNPDAFRKGLKRFLNPDSQVFFSFGGLHDLFYGYGELIRNSRKRFR